MKENTVKNQMVALTLESLGKLNAEMFGPTVDNAFAAVNRDLEQRPGLKKPRTLTITVTITPSENGLEAVEVMAQVATKMPPHKTLGEYLTLKPADADGIYQPKLVFANQMTPLFISTEGN